MNTADELAKTVADQVWPLVRAGDMDGALGILARHQQAYRTLVAAQS